MLRKKHFTSGWRTRAGALAALGIVMAGASLPAVAGNGPPLGAARSFVVLGGSTVANTGLSVFTGSVGVSPGSSITGFPPGIATGGTHANDAAAAAAHSDAALAYAFLLGMQSSPANDRTGVDLGGKTLTPGVYHFDTSAQLTGQLRLDAQGDSNALFVIKIGSTLTTASASSVVVINGGADYDESNVYWQVGSSATLGSGTSFIGHILASASITVVAGSSMTGNALALNGAVTTDSNTNSTPAIIVPPPVVPPGPLPPLKLTAVLAGTLSNPSADLSWNDASTNETAFRVYRRDGAGPTFSLIATVPSTDTAGFSATVTYHDPVLVASTIYTYRVTAFGAGPGESVPSNDALIMTGGAAPAVLAPMTLTAVLSGSVAAPTGDLSWNDASTNETEFRVYRRESSGPAFLLVGTVPSTTTLATGGTVTFHDPVLLRSTTYTYRVTAFNAVDGESPPSNEALIDTSTPPTRWLDVHLGGEANVIRDNRRAGHDGLAIRGNYAVIDVDPSATNEATVSHDGDPRISGITIRINAPGQLVLLTIPANDPHWMAQSRRGVFRWKVFAAKGQARTTFLINTRKSEFVYKSTRNTFGSALSNPVTVTLTYLLATGSDVRVWNFPAKLPVRTTAVFRLPK